MAEPEIDAADAIEYVEQFMQAQGAYNPAAIAALAYARKALAENVSLRAALAGAEQATTDARRLLTALATAVGQYHDTETRSTERENELRRALGEAEYDAWDYLRPADPNVDPLPSRWSSTIRGGHRPEALAADVPAAADELSCPCPAVGVFSADCVLHGDHPDAVPAASPCEARSALERIANEIPKLDGLDDERLTKGLEWIHQVATGALTGQCTHGHYYLSTACNPVHDLHEPECGAAQRARGDNSHPHCKYCDSPCVCPCHSGGPVERAERVHVDGCTLAADDPHHTGWCVLAVGAVSGSGEPTKAGEQP